MNDTPLRLDLLHPDPWRCALRRVAIARRQALDTGEHLRLSVALHDRLTPLSGALRSLVTGFCWPYRAEFDPREFASSLYAQSGVVALCALAEGDRDLSFRRWHPDAALVPGAYGIPIPRDGEVVAPDVLLVPMNAFDERGYRLGYGAGYFDRYLAARDPRPVAIGVCFEMFRLETIHPAGHDRPMDFIVTDAGIYETADAGTEPRLPAAAVASLRHLAQARGLTAAHGAPARGDTRRQ